MKKHNTNIGAELLFLLRQRRYLYHQLKILVGKQQQLAGTGSPELLLEVITGRRKLIEKLRELDDKLQPIKANWHRLSHKIEPEHRVRAHEMENQVQEIIRTISSAGPSETLQDIHPYRDWKFDELFVETQT